MGAAEDSIREELIAAVLGELSLMRRDVSELSKLLKDSGKQFKDDGELTLLRMTTRYEQFLKQFSESSGDVLEKAASFEQARDHLLAELSLRQYDEANGRSRELLREVLQQERHRGGFISRKELAIWLVGAVLATAALSVALPGFLTGMHLFGK